MLYEGELTLFGSCGYQIIGARPVGSKIFETEVQERDLLIWMGPVHLMLERPVGWRLPLLFLLAAWVTALVYAKAAWPGPGADTGTQRS